MTRYCGSVNDYVYVQKSEEDEEKVGSTTFEDILSIRPSISSVKSETEPSLNQLIENYYKHHFPDKYEEYAEHYLAKLKECIIK